MDEKISNRDGAPSGSSPDPKGKPRSYQDLINTIVAEWDAIMHGFEVSRSVALVLKDGFPQRIDDLKKIVLSVPRDASPDVLSAALSEFNRQAAPLRLINAQLRTLAPVVLELTKE